MLIHINLVDDINNVLFSSHMLNFIMHHNSYPNLNFSFLYFLAEFSSYLTPVFLALPHLAVM